MAWRRACPVARSSHWLAFSAGTIVTSYNSSLQNCTLGSQSIIGVVTLDLIKDCIKNLRRHIGFAVGCFPHHVEDARQDKLFHVALSAAICDPQEPLRLRDGENGGLEENIRQAQSQESALSANVQPHTSLCLGSRQKAISSLTTRTAWRKGVKWYTLAQAYTGHQVTSKKSPKGPGNTSGSTNSPRARRASRQASCALPGHVEGQTKRNVEAHQHQQGAAHPPAARSRVHPCLRPTPTTRKSSQRIIAQNGPACQPPPAPTRPDTPPSPAGSPAVPPASPPG